MWPSLIEVDNISLEESGEVLVVEDQEVIQAFSPHCAGYVRRVTHDEIADAVG
jgi:hypothetical protein